MPRTKTRTTFGAELASFLARRPTREQLLDYRPSMTFQRRAELLLQKQSDGGISFDERQELEEFAHAERLMRLIKAKLRSARPTQA